MSKNLEFNVLYERKDSAFRWVNYYEDGDSARGFAVRQARKSGKETYLRRGVGEEVIEVIPPTPEPRPTTSVPTGVVVVHDEDGILVARAQDGRVHGLVVLPATSEGEAEAMALAIAGYAVKRWPDGRRIAYAEGIEGIPDAYMGRTLNPRAAKARAMAEAANKAS